MVEYILTCKILYDMPKMLIGSESHHGLGIIPILELRKLRFTKLKRLKITYWQDWNPYLLIPKSMPLRTILYIGS